MLVVLIFTPLVPRLLGDHLSPPHPDGTPTVTKCSGTDCK